MAERTRKITRKVNVIITLILIAGIGGILFFSYTRIINTIDNSVRQNFGQQADILFAAIENFMIPGEAELAVSFFESMQDMANEYRIYLYRSNGIAAFSDTATIETVVAKRPILAEQFSMASRRISVPEPVVDEYFAVATGGPPTRVFFETSDETAVFARAYLPLINLPKCTVCHGADHTVRGVIDIRSDITEIKRTEQQRTAIVSGGLFITVVVFLTLLLAMFLRRTVIRPVKVIGAVCTGVTEGDFSKKVAIRNRDELGVLAATVNSMVDGLHERFELTKFVSSKTLESLLGDRTGKTASLTMLFSDIRGFTSYSEKRSPDNVVTFLNQVLNTQTEIIHAKGGDVDKYVGDAVVAMWSGEDQAEKAVEAAKEIIEALSSHNDERFDGLRVGIGINTGEVILGMIGSERRADFTFIGDNVNVAARLCDAAEPGQILLTASTFALVRGKIDVDGPYRLEAKGKGEFVKVYIVKPEERTDA